MQNQQQQQHRKHNMTCSAFFLNTDKLCSRPFPITNKASPKRGALGRQMTLKNGDRNIYRKIPTQRPPPSKRPPPFSAPKVLQRGHISSCNRPERLFLGTCRLTLYEKCSVMVTFLFHQLSCQMKLPSNRPSPS